MSATIEADTRHVRPFGRLTGRVRWSGGGEAPPLELRAFWRTSGRGTEEVGVVETVPLRIGGNGSAEFSITLPGRPWSFSGRLVSVGWALELVGSDGAGLALEEFVLSPDGEVRTLDEVTETRRKKKWFG